MDKLKQRYIIWRINRIRQRAISRRVDTILKARERGNYLSLGVIVASGLTAKEQDKLFDLRDDLARTGFGFVTIEELLDSNLRDLL